MTTFLWKEVNGTTWQALIKTSRCSSRCYFWPMKSYMELGLHSTETDQISWDLSLCDTIQKSENRSAELPPPWRFDQAPDCGQIYTPRGTDNSRSLKRASMFSHLHFMHITCKMYTFSLLREAQTSHTLRTHASHCGEDAQVPAF